MKNSFNFWGRTGHKVKNVSCRKKGKGTILYLSVKKVSKY